ncbi:MAG: RibD family protein [Clostridia bacterium]|nr:RibD family protein [Clostridia bacterium]
MKRPYIICHMVQSIDGKVTGKFLSAPECEKAIGIYYELNRNYNADAFACGRVTMEESFTGKWYPDLSRYDGSTVPSDDYIADADAGFYAVSFDRHGKLGWKTPRIIDDDPGYDGAHIIEVITRDTDKRYLEYLRSIGVSYIFAGEHDTDIALTLKKLYSIFGIKKLLLEGGSILNGAFERERLIDELSLVTVPMFACGTDKPLFMNIKSKNFTLEQEKSYGDVVWERYLR